MHNYDMFLFLSSFLFVFLLRIPLKIIIPRPHLPRPITCKNEVSRKYYRKVRSGNTQDLLLTPKSFKTLVDGAKDGFCVVFGVYPIYCVRIFLTIMATMEGKTELI